MKILILLLAFILFSDCIHSQLQNPDLKLVAEWKNLEFTFPSPEHRSSAIAEGKFVSTNIVPIDVDVYYSGKVL